jgi:hypothetical protein
LARRAKFRFTETPNQVSIPAIPFRQEGRSRVVTNAGWDVVDATASARMAVAGRDEPRERCAGAQDERRFSVRQNCVVLTPQRLALSLAEVLRAQPGGQNHIREATVSNKPDRRGEHSISRKAITQGMPDASAEPVCSCAHPLSHCARDRGLQRAPGIPCALFSRVNFAKTRARRAARLRSHVRHEARRIYEDDNSSTAVEVVRLRKEHVLP